MTPNRNGRVREGGACYLMPLCKWHNSTGRDGERFEHEETLMLRLGGYMEGELATTFYMRLNATSPYSVLYFDDVDRRWKFKHVDENQLPDIDAVIRTSALQTAHPYHILFKQTDARQHGVSIQDVKLPDH
jgi:hypothetical protein